MNKLTCTAIAVAIAALSGAGLASAKERAVARLVGISGNVLVSDDQTIASAGEALRLRAGMRVLVTLNSSATVEYDNGCRLKIRAGERIEIREDRNCGARAMSAGIAYAPVLATRR